MLLAQLHELHKHVFVNKISEQNFNHLLSNFENLTYASPKDYHTSGYEREYKTHYDLLLFYLDRIV